ncbi:MULTISPECIES: hypothetical protein [Psychrobacter]|uniref:Lipoprotein n=1 Tax=Psychrobacter alimentarius TaxID=261164 RepID=A0ABN4N1E6_9GAMM|nr:MULTISPECIES: hypothetical protein [Psychrobacter]AMT96798.1 hypothetical protein A3K91_1192 [Psychrobacter alimentarius]QCB30834.1 hypothetical protein E5677_07455 [Psychrobacter sp. PAMC27889]
MSSTYQKNPNRQHCSKIALHHSSTHNESSHSHKPYKLVSIARCALLLGSTSLILAGCQSNLSDLSSTAVSNKMIDFNIADTAQNQAQGRALNASLNADSEHYEQLFNQDKYPNTENQAKAHLLTAIRQHLTSEHVAVAQANYQAVPFIHPDSIDAGSSSLLKTIIETYVYQSGVESDYSENSYDENDYDEGSYDYTDADTADEVVIDEENVSNAMPEDSSEEYEAAESAAIARVLEEAGENDESTYSGDDDSYNDNYDNEEDSGTDYERGGRFSGLKAKNLLQNYEAMQMAKQQPKTMSEEPASSTGLIGNIFTMFHRTPEQIAASNAYQYKHLTFNSVSHYQPQKRQLQSVYSYDYLTPTIGSSIQIPLAFDFNNSKIKIDPSAIMPIVAIVNPENTPLPNQMVSHTVSFGLPESITSQLPPAVLYDAAISAIQNSMAELAPEHFSAVDIGQDRFAKEVGASRAVKVYFGSQQSGEMIGKVLKYMTQSLQQYVDTHPEKYPDGAPLKAALDKAALYNKGYQSADVGALLQLIEAIGPITFNQINYYYLDSSDRLLAKQQRMNIGGDLLGSTTTVLNQVRYDKASFDKHALTPLLAESFGANAKPAIDGNAWMTAQRQQEDRLQAARYARYDYSDNRADDEYPRDYENSEDSYNDDSNEDYSITQTDDETDNNIKAW